MRLDVIQLQIELPSIQIGSSPICRELCDISIKSIHLMFGSEDHFAILACFFMQPAMTSSIGSTGINSGAVPGPLLRFQSVFDHQTLNRNTHKIHTGIVVIQYYIGCIE